MKKRKTPTLNHSRARRIIIWALTLPLIAVVGWLILNANPTTTPQPIPTPAPQMSNAYARQIVVAALDEVNPAKPDNAYFPPYLQEKLAWIFAMASNKLLAFNIVGQTEQGEKLTYMSSLYKDGKPFIEISATILETYMRNSPGPYAGMDRRTKNSFAIALAHEAGHLEMGAEFLGGVQQAPERRVQLQEEIRVWAKTSLGTVRQLRISGEPMLPELVLADEVLQSCGDDMNCAKFRNHIASITR